MLASIPDVTSIQNALAQAAAASRDGLAVVERLGPLVSATGNAMFIGTTSLVGASINGDRNVNFMPETPEPGATLGYGSAWPEWAARVAYDACLHQRKVVVVCVKEPVGPQLLTVLIL